MRMHVRIITAASALTALAVVAAPAGAQLASTTATDISGPRASGTSLEVTPYAGYMMFGHFIDGPLDTTWRAAPRPSMAHS